MLGWISTACCLIVIASFALFAANQTNAASQGQINELGNAQPVDASGTNVAGAASTSAASSHESASHKLLDEAAETLTSPFSGVTSSSHSVWYVRTIGMLLAVLLYGLVLRYLLRMYQVRTRRPATH
jgi:hypothetical protein